MHKEFNYYLAEDITIRVEVWYRESDGEFIIDEITAANPDNGMDIFGELNGLYERKFSSCEFISVADKITNQAEEYWNL